MLSDIYHRIGVLISCNVILTSAVASIGTFLSFLMCPICPITVTVPLKTVICALLTPFNVVNVFAFTDNYLVSVVMLQFVCDSCSESE